LTTFYIGIVIVFIGLGSVAWLMFREKKGSDEKNESSTEEGLESTDKILDRLGLSEDEAKDAEEPEENKSLLASLSSMKLFGLEKLFNRFKKEEPEVISGPISQTINPPQKSEQGTPRPELGIQPPLNENIVKLKADDELTKPTSEDSALKEKNTRLEALFKEKSEELEKTHNALANEIKNRKEFNKVKDILEKELRETKDNARKVQVELNTASTEIAGLKKRINQLEEKVSVAEKAKIKNEDTVKEKDQKIEHLTKSLQILEESHAKKEPEEEKIDKTQQEPQGETPEARSESQPTKSQDL